jgi:autophagy-related protein 9
MEKLVNVQDKIKLSNFKKLNSVDILNRIMRKENYLISLFNKDILQELTGKYPLSKSLLYNIKLILSFIIQQEEPEKEEKLKRFIFGIGILNIVISPFIFIFIIFEMFLKYFVEYKNNVSGLMDRKWTNLSKWKLRQFNELDHYFKFRLNSSFKLSMEYCNQFPNQLTSIIFKFISFVSSSLVSIIIMFSLFQNIFTFQIFGNNLMVYLSMLIIVWTVSKSSTIEKNSNFDPNEKLKSIMKNIEYSPDHWLNRAHKLEVRDEFQQMFQYHFIIFFHEIISIFITPYLLLTHVYSLSGNLLTFVDQSTIEMSGVGNICIDAAFNKEKEKMDEKLERSIHNFHSHYPNSIPNINVSEVPELNQTNLDFNQVLDNSKLAQTNEVFIDLQE